MKSLLCRFFRKPSTDEPRMDDHIALPGTGDVIVTREFARRWMMEKLGHPGGVTLDHILLSEPAVARPLTDLTNPPVARFLAGIERRMQESGWC